MIVYAILAMAGAALIAAGLAVWSLSVGLVAAGVELVAAAYGGAYMAARKPAGRPARGVVRG